MKPVVAAYTCPLWHPSAHFAEGFGAGWSEYTVMRGARPWFAGHHQPRTPLLGERDESAAGTWELYNQLAAGHGVDVLIWDTYWYDGRPALHEALDAASPLPFFPGVSPGYDESPRTIPDVTPWWEGAPRARAASRAEQADRRNWPGAGLIVVGETPEGFEAHVRDALDFLRERPGSPPVVTLGCWNEFTEGQYLLPDTRFGYGMLQALARACSRL